MGTDRAIGTTTAINICHIASGDLWAGAEAVLFNLLVELARRGEIQAKAILLNDGILAQKLRENGVDVTIIPESENGLLSLFFKLRKALRESVPVVVHTHRYKEHILGGIAAKLVGVPHLVCTIHGMAEPLRGLRKLKARLKSAIEAFIFRRLASAVVPVSRDIAGQMKRQFGKTPIAVIHNGISMPGLEAADFRDESTGISGPVQICTAGRLNPIKGYDHLIRAAGVLVERGLDFQLLIIGDGPLRRQLESQANEMDVSAFVQFLGFDPNPLEVIKRCQIFVLSSLHEGISIALLEALSLGKVAVVTDVGGNREIVTHDVSGLLVTPTDHVMLADALERLIREPKLREALGAAGKEVVRNHFTDVAMADATQELYQKLTKTE